MNATNIGAGSNGGRSETASGSVEGLKQQAGEAAERAKAKLDSARQPAADKLHAAAEAIRDNAGRLPGGETISGAAHTAADKLEASADYLETHDTREMVTDALAVVKRYPVQALLIAGALGFLMARALRNNE